MVPQVLRELQTQGENLRRPNTFNTLWFGGYTFSHFLKISARVGDVVLSSIYNNSQPFLTEVLQF